MKHKKYEARTFKFDFKRYNPKYVIGDGDGFFDLFIEKVEQIQEFENPDMLLELDNCILAIEHFCFDSGKLNRKGSLFRQNDFAKQKHGDRLAQNRGNEIEVFEYKDYVDGEMSYLNYCQSLIMGFEKHYEKLSQYEAHIKTIFPMKEIKYVFLIEDATPLGNIIVDKNKKLYPLFPLICPEFLKLLYERQTVSYIICKSTYEYLATYYLFKNKVSNLDLCMAEAFDNIKETFVEHGYTHTARYHSFEDDEEESK